MTGRVTSDSPRLPYEMRLIVAALLAARFCLLLSLGDTACHCLLSINNPPPTLICLYTNEKGPLHLCRRPLMGQRVTRLELVPPAWKATSAYSHYTCIVVNPHIQKIVAPLLAPLCSSCTYSHDIGQRCDIGQHVVALDPRTAYINHINQKQALGHDQVRQVTDRD